VSEDDVAADDGVLLSGWAEPAIVLLVLAQVDTGFAVVGVSRGFVAVHWFLALESSWPRKNV